MLHAFSGAVLHSVSGHLPPQLQALLEKQCRAPCPVAPTDKATPVALLSMLCSPLSAFQQALHLRLLSRSCTIHFSHYESTILKCHTWWLLSPQWWLLGHRGDLTAVCAIWLLGLGFIFVSEQFRSSCSCHALAGLLEEDAQHLPLLCPGFGSPFPREGENR